MADDGLFFESIARVHPRFKTPHVAILLAAVLGMALVMSRSFEALTDTFVLAIWPFYALSVAAIYRLRRPRPDLPRPYKVVGYPVVPAVFIAAVVWFVINALITRADLDRHHLRAHPRRPSGLLRRVRRTPRRPPRARLTIFLHAAL